MPKLKRHSGITIFIAGAVIITAVIIFVVKLTAHYPELAEPVSYSVNQLNGFKMEIEGVHWSFRKGYCAKYKIEIDSEEIYTLVDTGEKSYEYLERLLAGQWYRFVCNDIRPFPDNSHEIGGPGNTGYEEGFYQKYDGYGTRLETGIYRIVLELTDGEGNIQYLADEFEVK